MASCWVEISHDGSYLFAVNTASASISSYSIGSGGALTFLHSTLSGEIGAGAEDARLSPDGSTLWVVESGTNAVTGFSVSGGISPRCPQQPARQEQHPPASSSPSTDAWGEAAGCAASPHTSRRAPAIGAPGKRKARAAFVTERPSIQTNRWTKASAVSATSRQPLSIISECPRPGISMYSVTPSFFSCFLYDALAIAGGTVWSFSRR